MALVRIARQAELPEGGKLVKESHGRKILVARAGGRLYATDAHCFHMGGNLWEGDIEDVGGHACVVCPMHRYKIDMSSGHKVDTMLDGCVSCSSAQQQRTYAVHQDADFIWIDIPELHVQKPLPSDRYNQVAAAAPAFPQGGTAGRSNYGLFGSSGARLAAQAEPLAPYAGFGHRGLVPGTPAKEGAADEPALQLSQEAGSQLGAEAALQQQQQQAVGAFTQGHIPFAQSRVDTARIARRKAATAAIAARAYKPPSAPAGQHVPAARGLFGSAGAPQPAAGLARTASNGGQQSLLSFGFTVQQRQAVGVGPEAMDME